MRPDQVEAMIQEGLAAWPASPLIDPRLVHAALRDALMPLLSAGSAAAEAPRPAPVQEA